MIPVPTLPPKDKEEADGGPPSLAAAVPDNPPGSQDATNLNLWHCPFPNCKYKGASKGNATAHINGCAKRLLLDLRTDNPGATIAQLVELGAALAEPQSFDAAGMAWCPECGKILGTRKRRSHKGNNNVTCPWLPPPAPKASKVPKDPKAKLAQIKGSAGTQRPSSWVENRFPAPAAANTLDSSTPADQLHSVDLAQLTQIPIEEIVRLSRQARLVDPGMHRLNAHLAATWSAALQETCNAIRHHNNPASWRLWLMIGPCTLRVPNGMRQSRAEWKSWDVKVLDRLLRWRRGDIMSLWEELCADVERAPMPFVIMEDQDTSPVKKRLRVLRLIRLGRVADAVRALTAEALAPLNEVTIQTLQEKFPPAPEGADMPLSALDPGDVPLTAECIRKCIMSFPRGSGAGLSGITPDLLKLGLNAAIRAKKEDEFLECLVQLMMVLCQGQAPEEIAPWLCGGRLVPVGTKVRPIVVSDILARLCSKAMLSLQLDTALHNDIFKGIQGGVGEPGAIERTIHALRKEMTAQSNQLDYGVLQIDFRNGFNSVFRAPIMEELNKHTPALARWFHWAHARPLALVLANGTRLEAPNGTGQGDPASPAYFAMTLQPVINRIMDDWGASLGVCRAYLDDIVLSGPVQTLTKILGFLRSDPSVAARGLTIRPDKCCLFMPNQGLLDGLRGQYNIPEDIQLVTGNSGITVLGVPIGSLDHVERALTDIAASIKRFGDELEGLGHGQLELLLHSYSGGANSVLHLFRSLPSHLLAIVTRACNEETSRLLERLTAPATELTASMQAQAYLPRRYGGLGLVDVTRVGDAAFISASIATLPSDDDPQRHRKTLAQNLDFTSALSLYNRLVNVKDCMSVDSVLQQKPSQKALMEKVHCHHFDLLGANAAQLDLARLKEQASCGASSWLQPRFKYGNPILTTETFPLLVVRHLRGEFKAIHELHCPRRVAVAERAPCYAAVDAKLEHVTVTCKAFLTERHKTLAAALHRICNEAGLAASTEVQCIPGSLKIPADLYIYGAAPNVKPTAIDVGVTAVTHQASWGSEHGSNIRNVERTKMNKYANDLKNAPNLDFVPFIMSSYGSFGQKARSFITLLATCLCRRWVTSMVEAEDYIRSVIQAEVLAFIGDLMLRTLSSSSMA
jgi:hypothetical protein